MAPDLLPLKRGDVLVCDASDKVLLGRGTSPEALQRFLDAGVTVLSQEGLHAKVLVTSKVAVIGSANASQHSTCIDEAVVVTDSPAVLRQARSFIEALVAAVEVDDDFLVAARETWNRGRPGSMSAVRRPRTSDEFLPTTFRMYLSQPDTYKPSKAEQTVVAQQSRRARQQVGPASMYVLDSYRLPVGERPFRRGDVIIDVDMGARPSVGPPVVVVSDPVPVPGSRRRVQLTKGLAKLNAIDLDEAKEALATAGVNARLDRERWVRSAAVQDEMLGLWGLSKRPPDR